MEIKNNKLLILILGLLTAFGPISIDLYLPGFIEMAEDLKVPVSSIQYTLSSFFIGLSVGQLIYGPISDRIGRKKPLLFGIALFIITSFLIAVVKDLDSFVALRFVQALGSCVGMVITRAIIRDSFRTKDIAKVFSLIILIMGVTPIFAPIIGSQILVFFNWRVMFVLLGSFGILAFLASALFIKETLVEPVAYRKSFQNYLNLFSDKSFIIASLVTGTAMAAMFSYISSSSFVFLELLGATKNQYPLFFGLNAMGFIILSQVNIKLLNHYSIDQILKVAMGLFFFYSLLLCTITYFNLGLYFFEAGLFLQISCIGLIMPNMTTKALEFQTHRAGVASALMGSLQFLIASTGTMMVAALSSFGIWSMVLSILIFVSISACLFLCYHWTNEKIELATL